MENAGTNRDFVTHKNSAEIFQVDLDGKENDNALRLYPYFRAAGGDSYVFALQIRTHKPIVNGGKPRNMVADVHLTFAELKELLDIAEAQMSVK